MVAEFESGTHPLRRGFVRSLALAEDVVYAGLGVLLAIAAIALLISTFKTAFSWLWTRNLSGEIVGFLDQILLVLLVIELLYTVQVSFREHALIAEPFIVVALIAAIRRVLVVTAELPKLPQSAEPVFRHAILELSLLTVMILVLVVSLIMLQRHSKQHKQ